MLFLHMFSRCSRSEKQHNKNVKIGSNTLKATTKLQIGNKTPNKVIKTPKEVTKQQITLLLSPLRLNSVE